MPLSDDDKDVKKRAVDNIMKLIHSQLALEKKQAKMDAKVCSICRPCLSEVSPSNARDRSRMVIVMNLAQH